jgi:hypothetical protein
MLDHHSVSTTIQPFQHHHQVMHRESQTGLEQKSFQLLVVYETCLLAVYQSEEVSCIVSFEPSSD